MIEQLAKHIVVTGAAGLVGQNLILLLSELGYKNITAIDKHADNLKILTSHCPDVSIICTDLASTDPEKGSWQQAIQTADIIVQLHAQITGLGDEVFNKNNVRATKALLEVAESAESKPYLIHVSSSVVNSVANDAYTRTKIEQQTLVENCKLKHCILRPTLMFGWFDPKHFGWLSRFMEKTPVFPIPGHGRFMRQPLYNRDFCRVIEWCIRKQPDNSCYDIVGKEEIDYIDIIKSIKRTKKLSTLILPIPFTAFRLLLKTYALFSKQPPFTADQLTALSAGDKFVGVDMESEFGFSATPFQQAITETFCHPVYSDIVVSRT